MIILAINTVGSACEAAILKNEALLSVTREPMQRGHDVRLPLVVEAALETASIQFSDIDRVGVVCGPGSFTGVRVGVAYVRGLGLGLDCPVIGWTSLEAARPDAELKGSWMGVSPARKRPPELSWWAQSFVDGEAIEEPLELDSDALGEELRGAVGVFGDVSSLPEAFQDVHRIESSMRIEQVAQLTRLADAAGQHAARPVYVRAPDAAPSRSPLADRLQQAKQETGS